LKALFGEKFRLSKKKKHQTAMPHMFKMEEDWKYSMEYKENSFRTGWFSHFPCGVCGSFSVFAVI